MERVDARMFAWWAAFFEIQDRNNPDFRADIRAALICQSVENSAKTNKDEPTRVSDRMPFFEIEEEEQTQEEVDRILGAR